MDLYEVDFIINQYGWKWELVNKFKYASYIELKKHLIKYIGAYTLSLTDGYTIHSKRASIFSHFEEDLKCLIFCDTLYEMEYESSDFLRAGYILA